MSWQQGPEEFHLFFNRDELLSRQPAQPPQPVVWGGKNSLAPLDGDAGGTWLAASQQGLLLCLLNYYPPHHLPSGDLPVQAQQFEQQAEGRQYRSRGKLIPRLLPRLLAGPKQRQNGIFLLRPFAGIALGDYRPFTLACFALRQQRAIAMRLYQWGQDLRIQDSVPRVLSSSGYRSAQIEAQRKTLFANWPGDDIEDHLAYHRSHLPAAGATSVCMHRRPGGDISPALAGQTLSFSHLRVRPQDTSSVLEWRYFDGPPCQAAAQEGQPAAGWHRQDLVLDRLA